MRGEERGSLYLLTGLVIGFGLGLLFARAFASFLVDLPVAQVNIAPRSLQQPYKDQIRSLIALAYVADGNLERAKKRLEYLGEADMLAGLASQAQQALSTNKDSEEARALGMLLVALGNQAPVPLLPATQALAATATSEVTPVSADPPEIAAPPATETPAPSLALAPSATLPPAPTETSAPPVASPTALPPAPATDTPAPSPTFLPTPPPGAPFVLAERAQDCSQALPQPLIRVLAVDAGGEPVAGVEAVVTWQEGEERFYTGLKPELGAGYADFTMTPGVVYTLRLSDGGELVSALAAVDCRAQGKGEGWGAWQLTFRRP